MVKGENLWMGVAIYKDNRIATQEFKNQNGEWVGEGWKLNSIAEVEEFYKLYLKPLR